MSTLDNQNAFMDKYIALTDASEAYASGIWHSLRDSDKDNPVRAAILKAYPITHKKREDDFKAELAELCNRHGIILKSDYDNYGDISIRANFKAHEKELHADCYSFTIDE